MSHDVLPWPFEPDRTVIDGRFRVKGIVGQGGMGRVYRVEDMNLFDRICVLKMLAPKLHPSQVPQHDASALLINEVKLLSLLSEISDSFVTIFGRGTAYVAVPLHAREGESRKHVELDLPYYVMELLQGTNFETLIERHKKEQAFLSWNIVLGLCSQAARALSIAHAKGIVHRDIKPNNLFLHEFGGRKPIVKFIDFGVSTQHGAPGVFGSGTKRYGSPELLRNGAPLIEDKQSDIYPLGLVMYELAALVHALVEYRADYAYAHLNETPTPLKARRADTPPGFEKIVHRALAKRPTDRPTADEIAKELDTIRASRGEDDDVAPHLSELLSSMRDRAAERKKPRITSDLPVFGLGRMASSFIRE